MAKPTPAKPTPAKPTPTKQEAAASTQPGNPADAMAGCQDVTVVIDPGHGDAFWEIGKDGKKKQLDKPDSGAVHPENPPHVAIEKDIALEVSKAIKTNLTGKPHIKAVVLTREADVTQSVKRYQWRLDVAKANDARVFVSVHVNSTAGATGHIIFYYSPNDAAIQAESLKLAKAISTVYKTIPAFKSGGFTGQTSRMGLIRFGGTSTVRSATLVETGFIQKDHPTLNSSAAAIGKEVAEGIATYIKDNLAALCK